MSGSGFGSLLDVARAQAQINAALGAGNTFSEIGEAVAAAVTGSVRVSGTGRDLKLPAPSWRRPPNPVGLKAPGPVRTPYSQVAPGWPARDQARYQWWLSDPDQIGEVRARQVSPQWAADQLAPTRGGGPGTPFFPLVDFVVVVLFDLDGDILMARHLDLVEMVDHVATDVAATGSWNYKVSISTTMTVGTDLTAAAQTALRELEPVPQRRLRLR